MSLFASEKNVSFCFFSKKKMSKITINTTYINVVNSKPKIYKDNRNKSGIYRWTNLINKESYIGRSDNLTKRFYYYFSIATLKRKVELGNSKIYNALLKYGYEQFSLDILEYCDDSESKEREQYYIDLLNPEYNIYQKSKILIK